MTKIKFEKIGKVFRFECKEHAEDKVVCSAISALSQTLVYALQNIKGNGSFNINSGDVTAEIEVEEEEYMKADIIFQTFFDGFTMLQLSYPQYVNIHFT